MAKKSFSVVKFIWKNPILRIISFISILALITGVVIFCAYQRQEAVDTTYLIAKLEKSSELTTAKLQYTGMSEFEDAGIAFINKSNFIMVYEATARIGIDVKEIEITADNLNKTIWLTIPKAKVFDVSVDTSKIKYFNEKFSLFNIDQKDDANKATALAREEAQKEINEIGVIEMANAQAEALIKGLINDLIPENYNIQIKAL